MAELFSSGQRNRYIGYCNTVQNGNGVTAVGFAEPRFYRCCLRQSYQQRQCVGCRLGPWTVTSRLSHSRTVIADVFADRQLAELPAQTSAGTRLTRGTRGGRTLVTTVRVREHATPTAPHASTSGALCTALSYAVCTAQAPSLQGMTNRRSRFGTQKGCWLMATLTLKPRAISIFLGTK